MIPWFGNITETWNSTFSTSSLDLSCFCYDSWTKIWCFHGNSVNGMLSLPVSVSFPCTDSNFYRQIKHIYKLLCNSCTTLPWSLNRPRTTKTHWRPLGVCVLRNYVKLRCFTRSYVHVNFGTLSKTCKIRSFKLSLCLYFKITAEFLIRAKKHFVFICKILLKSRQKSL